MPRPDHDCAHSIAVQMLDIFSPLLREEELKDAYEEMMPVILQALADFETRRRREAHRLNPIGGDL